MELTDAGREFLSSVREILAKVDDAMKVTRRHSEISGVISLAATYTVIGYFLPFTSTGLPSFIPGWISISAN